MRRAWPLFFLVFGLLPDVGHARQLVGGWEGALVHEGASLPVAVTFTSDTSGSIVVPDFYIESYDLSHVAREADPERIDASAVRFALEADLPSSFEGWIEDGGIAGTFAAIVRGDSVQGEFTLAPSSGDATMVRREEVRFPGADVELAGSLFLPTAEGLHPAVVLVHGSGPQTRETYLRFFADRLARRGVAALIYDKRGTGESGGVEWIRSGATFSDYAEDAVSAVEFLRTRPEIKTRHIGIWGLSQGAWIGPLAASRSDRIAFVVMISGGGVSPAEQELWDDEARLERLGFSEFDVAEAIALLRRADDYRRSQRGWDELQAALAVARERPWFPHLDKFPLILPREAPAWGGADLDYDPAPTLVGIEVPVLVILGSEDESTPTEETARRVRAALARSPTRDVTIEVLPDADHGLFLRAPDGSWDWPRPSPGWVDRMIDWIVARAPLAPR